ncbi:MAG TPA: hypothetical protein ENN25_02745 [Euryarchaeota archaeon]|nr:hypothetical protein [Euryarchaeota archaeon]
MKVMVVGAGAIGTEIIKQMHKNPRIEVIVVDPKDKPKAVAEGVIQKVDIRKHVTPLNFEEVVKEADPELVIIARTIEDWEQFDNLGGAQYIIGMERELTKFDIPVIPVSSQMLGPC